MDDGSEANREQAEKCAGLGLEAASVGDVDKAIRLLTKALRLHDLGPRMRARLAQLERQRDGVPESPAGGEGERGGEGHSSGGRPAGAAAPAQGAAPRGGGGGTGPNPPVRRVPSGPAPRAPPRDPPPQRPFTPEQAESAK